MPRARCFLDEPLLSVDGAGIRAFVAAIRTAFRGKRVLFVTHSNHHVEFGDTVVRIRSKHGCATVQ